MPGSITGAADFAALSARLKEAGATGLRRELYKAISKAADGLVTEISSLEHLKPYMPDRYAGVLASDLSVKAFKRGGADAHVTLRAESRAPRKRKLVQLDERGVLVHPVFGQGGGGPGLHRKDWIWRDQFSSVRQGFFTDPVERCAPAVRKEILAAMRETARKITTGG
jgi:hypothetical protein